MSSYLNILTENLQKHCPIKTAPQMEHCLLQKCTYKFDDLFISMEKTKPNKYINHYINCVFKPSALTNVLQAWL